MKIPNFEDIETYPINHVYRYEFEIEETNSLVSCKFSTRDEENYDFEYLVNNNEFQELIVPYSIYVRILSTISSIIIEFVENKQVDSIFLRSNSRYKDNITDNLKHKIHGHCLKMQIYKLNGYNYEERNDGWLIFK